MRCGFLGPVLPVPGAFWHHRGVPATPPSAEDHGAWPPAADQAPRRRRREEADDSGISDGSEMWPPVRRMISLGIAGFAALLTVGLVVGAQTTHESYAVVIFGVQVLFVGVWVIASSPPAPRVVAAVGIAVAIGTDVAAVLTWRVEMLYDNALADPRAATRPDQTLSYADRIPSTATGGLRDTLEQVAGVADRRIAGLAELAAVYQPAWTAALGPVPDDEHGRAQWVGRTVVVVAYRDRHTVPRDEAIGPEPSHRDAARWAAWHRGRIALGVATVAGQVAAAPDHELREWVALQRAADRAAPPYVGDELRAAHLQLAAAEHHVDDLRQRLAAAESVAERLRTTAPAHTPRWRRTSTIDVQTATRTAHQQRADDRVDRLTARLDHADRVVTERQTTVDGLEDRHATWMTNYEHTLPSRYLGLAAAAEQARRAHAADRRSDDLRAAVKAATSKVHAVDDSRPKPRTDPVDRQLPELANAGTARTAATLGVSDAQIDDDLEL